MSAIATVVDRHGLFNTARACSYMALLLWRSDTLGRVPDRAEMQEWLGSSRRTSYRDQAAAKDVFGEDLEAAILRMQEAGVSFDKRSAHSQGAALGLVDFA